MKTLVVILSLILAVVLVRLIIKVYHKSIIYGINHGNKVIKTFLESDNELAQLYVKRSNLDQFKIVELDNLPGNKMLRAYSNNQRKAIDAFKQCFKSYCARLDVEEDGINIDTLMDKERACLSHSYCDRNCIYYHELQGLITWDPFLIFLVLILHF